MSPLLRHISLLFLLLLLPACVTEGDEPSHSLEEGDMLPDFSVTLSDGTTVATRDLAGHSGAVVLFNTSCSDCWAELPNIQAAYDQAVAEGLDPAIVCIAREESASSIAPFWKSASLTLPYAPQPDRAVFNKFATSGIPRIYVFDSSLRITATFSDNLLPSPSDILAALRKAAAMQP